MDIRDYGFNPVQKEVFDSSMLKDFVDCPSKFYLRHILGLKQARFDPDEETKFSWGTCWHNTLYSYYNNNRSLEHALATMEETYPTYVTPSTDKYKRSKARMVEMFFAYVEKWDESDQKNLEIIRNEQFFDVYDPDIGLRWCGRTDSLRRRIGTNRIVVWDYKTASVMGGLYFDSHEVGFQFPGYVWSSGKLFGEPVYEICIDVAYMITASFKLQRKTFRYDNARLNEWIANVKIIIDQINRLQDKSLFDPNAWHKNWNECTKYGRCNFFDVHSISPKGRARLSMLQQNYKEERWDPSDF